MNKRMLMMAVAMLPVLVRGAVGDTFTANTQEGTMLRYKVSSEEDKTCSVFKLVTDKSQLSETLTIPEEVNGYAVISIDYRLFYGCNNLHRVVLPRSLAEIGESAFAYCSQLTDIHLPENIRIGENAFLNCTGLTEITIPKGVIFLSEGLLPSEDDFAFSGCTSITKVTWNASSYFTYLSLFPHVCELYIGKDVNNIGNLATSKCANLEIIKVANENTIYDSREDCNAIIETATNALISGCMSSVIPESITKIREKAFSSCKGLSEVNFPAGLKSIGKEAFYGCSGLTELNFPAGLTSIGDEAFYGCSGLTDITANMFFPFFLDWYIFDNSVMAKATLHVPFGTTDKYRRQDWNFTNIVEMGKSDEVVTSFTIPKDWRHNWVNTREYLDQFKELKEVLVEEGNSKYSSNNGLLCNKAGDSLVYVPYNHISKDGVIQIPIGIHVIPSVSYQYGHNTTFARSEGIIRLELQDSVSYVHFPNCQKTVLCNAIPPTMYNIPKVLIVPEGSGQTYYDKYINNVKSVLEQGNGVDDVLTPTFAVKSVYDVDGDGVMEPQQYEKLWREPDNELWAGSTHDSYIAAYHLVDGQAVTVHDNRNTFVADFDNDGRTDIAFFDGNSNLTIRMQQPDGSLLDTKQTITHEERELSNSGSQYGVLGYLSLRNGMIVESRAANDLFSDETRRAAAPNGPRKAVWNYRASGSSSNGTQAVDVNNDGILDLTGGLYYSLEAANHYFSPASVGGTFYPYDVDGDGVLDYVCYDGTTLYIISDVTSDQATRRELYKNTKIDQVIFRDFDHDGYIDILAFLCIKQSASYFVFLRNNGDGTFRRKEVNFADAEYRIISCGDYDADGCYEVVLNQKIRSNSKDVELLMKVNADFTMKVTQDKFVAEYGSYKYKTYTNKTDVDVVLGDFNNDGFTEFYSLAGNLYGHLPSQTKANTRPEKMSMPTAVLMPESNRLKIAWQRGEDAETSACDLTYELRIGTQPGLGDVKRAESMADGRRLTTCEGNQGTMLQSLFNAAALKPGKYYIAVQAIDQGGLGGEFSDEFVYEHELQAPQFYVSTNSLSTADTLQVYVKAIVPEATYKWTTSEGEIIEQTNFGAKVVFHQQGNHEIGLTMIADGINFPAAPQQVYVASMKASGLSTGSGLFDWNQDGYLDYISGNVYKNNSDGTFEQVLLSTFADWGKSTVRGILDFNRDGYPDMVVDGNVKGDIFLNYGEQDFDFDYQTVGINPLTRFNEHHPIDLNNDGLMDLDYIFEQRIGYLPNGTYIDKNSTSVYATDDGINYTERIIISGEAHKDAQLYDVNRDGFPDLVYKVEGEYINPTTEGPVRIFVHYKDNTQDFAYSEPQMLFSIPAELRIRVRSFLLADFNNDGFADLAFNGYNYLNGKETDDAFFIMKGHPDGNSSEVVVTIDEVNTFALPTDLNNDGCIDIPYIAKELTKTSSNEHIVVFKPDFTYELQPYSNEPNNSPSQSRFIVPFTDKGDVLFNGTIQKTNIQNLSPSAPAQVAVKQTRDGMLITWNDAQDDHTPAVQMRYNISVKRKGKTGDNAFVISPMNGLRDEAAIVPGYYYKQSTQMLVPSTVLTIGETYEIQVQAIDLWGAHSPMTKAVEFTMGSDGYIEGAERVAVDTETFIALRSAQAGSYSIDPGEDGEVIEDHGSGQYTVKWSTPGVKTYTITAGTTSVSSSVTVVTRVDVSFEVPEQVLAGAPILISVSDEMALQSAGVGFTCNGARAEYVPGSKTATIEFPSTGTYELTAYFNDDVRGNRYTKTVQVTNAMPEAAISRVDVDAYSQYLICWDELPEYIDRVVVCKEGTVTNWFAPVDTVDAAACSYADASSNAMVNSSRYALRLLATNGQESAQSAPHTPLHIMLNYSPMGGYNLMWNAYQGLSVGSYIVWRGIDKEDMQPIAYLSGYQLSYTDLNAPNADYVYYFVSFIPTGNYSFARGDGRQASAYDDHICSNIISTENAVSVVSAKQIRIIATTEELKLTDAQPSMQLYGIILPAYTTITRVAWTIIEGNSLATIDSHGLLKALGGEGTVTVRATTLDGSNLTADLIIPVEVITSIDTGIQTVEEELENRKDASAARTFDVYTLNGRKVRHQTTSLNGLPKGVYIVSGQKVLIR